MTDPGPLGGVVPVGDGLNTYRRGAAALVEMGASISAADWWRPSACAGWNATSLVGHMLCVIGWHHDWLDRAEVGDTSRPWPAWELDERNRIELDRLEPTSGPERLQRFAAEAHRYAERLRDTWVLPYAYPGGLLTAGMHAVLAAGEWQLHTWDLGEAIGAGHAPDERDARLIRQVWLHLGRSVTEEGDPWAALLEASGRVPDEFDGEVVVAREEVGTPDVAALIETHLALSRATTPAAYSFALSGSGLAEPSVTLYSARQAGRLLGIAALRQLEPSHVELKSMHTVRQFRGRGVAARLLEELIAVATAQGYGRMSLETGGMDAFASARRLYARAGFVPCPPFGEYRSSPYNTFMTLVLKPHLSS
ncbi:MAG: GNAT family N-acetyltransferase [Acidimicrobiales bacterium]